MSGWALFIAMFVVALLFWAGLWRIITWGYDKIVAMFTTKFERK